MWVTHAVVSVLLWATSAIPDDFPAARRTAQARVFQASQHSFPHECTIHPGMGQCCTAEAGTAGGVCRLIVSYAGVRLLSIDGVQACGHWVFSCNTHQHSWLAGTPLLPYGSSHLTDNHASDGGILMDACSCTGAHGGTHKHTHTFWAWHKLYLYNNTKAIQS